MVALGYLRLCHHQGADQVAADRWSVWSQGELYRSKVSLGDSSLLLVIIKLFL
jgi:hypothetical protein